MVAVGDLYSHRSGLPDHAGDKLEEPGLTTAATFWSGCANFPLDPFRISYAYTNFGAHRRRRSGLPRQRASRGRTSAEQVLYRPLGAIALDEFAVRRASEARGREGMGPRPPSGAAS